MTTRWGLGKGFQEQEKADLPHSGSCGTRQPAGKIPEAVSGPVAIAVYQTVFIVCRVTLLKQLIAGCEHSVELN
jgi:hypothetical protein